MLSKLLESEKISAVRKTKFEWPIPLNTYLYSLEQKNNEIQFKISFAIFTVSVNDLVNILLELKGSSHVYDVRLIIFVRH